MKEIERLVRDFVAKPTKARLKKIIYKDCGLVCKCSHCPFDFIDLCPPGGEEGSESEYAWDDFSTGDAVEIGEIDDAFVAKACLKLAEVVTRLDAGLCAFERYRRRKE